MPRRISVPTYRFHKGSGQAFVYHRSIANKSHRLYLGKHGTEESLSKYRQFLRRLELTAPKSGHPQDQNPGPLAISDVPTIFEIAVAYDRYMLTYYVDENKAPRREYFNQKASTGHLLDLFGMELAEDFGPKSLRLVQQAMAQDNYCRNHVNECTSRIKRLFKWASCEELIKPTIYDGLRCVSGLRFGEMGVRESNPVLPARMESVKKLLPFVSPVIAAMIEVQYLCAMRPCEVRDMRPCEIDQSGEIWLYVPRTHKTRRYGRQLIKGIPRAAQAILRPFMQGIAESKYIFSPDESASAMRERAIASRPARKTPRYPSEKRRVDQKKSLAESAPRERFAKDSYNQAVSRGYEKAKRAGVKLERFTPNQLRHSIITYVSQELGQEKAQRYAGHAHLSTTEIYNEITAAEIVRVAKRLDELWGQAT